MFCYTRSLVRNVLVTPEDMISVFTHHIDFSDDIFQIRPFLFSFIDILNMTQISVTTRIPSAAYYSNFQ